TVEQISCTTLVDVHDHKLQSGQLAHLNARYRKLSNEMMEDLRFLTEYIYNAIYRLCKRYKNKKPDSSLFLEALFEKMALNPDWKDLYQRFHDVVLNDNTSNALVEDEMASIYVWILRYLMKATGDITPILFWTNSEPDLINAASHIFPATQYFYCLFHIWQNIVKHLKTKLNVNFNAFSKAFYSYRNVLSTELFEQCWKIQNTQSVESFNSIIKKSLNSISMLCDVEKIIEKRLDNELQYNKLVDLKAPYILIRLPHLSLQFFTNINAILVQFLTFLILSWQQFQISQSLTYEGCLVPFSVEILEIDTVNDVFIEDISDEPQIILKSLLNRVEVSSIIELWRIRRIGRLSYRENIVILLSNGTHLCTCMETVTKEIICRHFWYITLYSSNAKFYISIIPARWYKNNIVNQLYTYLKNSLVLTAIKPCTETLSLPSEANFTFQSLRQFQKLEHNDIICHATPLRNQFGIAFSVSKTAINIALETKSDEKLIQMLKNFITVKRQACKVSTRHDSNNSCDNNTKNESDEVVSL
ncbi:7803_t:CDS:2, partial [Racocetra persica]